MKPMIVKMALGSDVKCECGELAEYGFYEISKKLNPRGQTIYTCEKHIPPNYLGEQGEQDGKSEVQG